MGTATDELKRRRLQQAWDEAIAACRELDRGIESGNDSICQRYQKVFGGAVLVLHQLSVRPGIGWLCQAEGLLRPQGLDTISDVMLLVSKAAALLPIPSTFTESDWERWRTMMAHHQAQEHEEAERLARLLASRHGGTQGSWLYRATHALALNLPAGINI